MSASAFSEAAWPVAQELFEQAKQAQNAMTEAKSQEWKEKVEKGVNPGSAWAHNVAKELASSAQVAVMPVFGHSGPAKPRDGGLGQATAGDGGASED